ncbi:hypothetical protein GGI15_001226 [Coemansia interrupta]|uniref:Uncharacterized protein n=1 Tax=Coemansia interrupta TaxID=1126814 RepID=A0A9W8LLL7_9FUNG|nr:hypothetical protein GGI15_001226 [Coemansia interrupta]
MTTVTAMVTATATDMDTTTTTMVTTTFIRQARSSNIIHTEFRYVSGFKPFQFDAPGSCLGPLVAEDQKKN